MGAHLDGNALAGPLSALSQEQLLVATGTCGTCGDTARLAECVVDVDDHIYVARCRSCESVLACVVDRPDRMQLRLCGFSSVVIVTDADRS